MIPKVLLVRGARWKVFREVPITDLGEICDGICDGAAKIIYIHPDLKDERLIETFIHEYLHAVWFETGIDDEDVPPWIEHMFINGIAKDVVLNIKLFRRLLG